MAEQPERNALWRREEQLNRWLLSETHKENPERKSSGSVRFQDGCVFLAACSSGDKDEVKRLLSKGADINTANVDGLTALHQACIDGNLDMVKYLVELGAGIDVCDNEGWTALHATASCGLLDIAKYLISVGASVSAVNNDGELAFDLAEGDAMENLLAAEMDKQGIDADAARNEEEDMMTRDANRWLQEGYSEDVHSKTGASALHVAAAKGYINVMNLLLQAGADIDCKDFDGWTPLHAAAHWGQEEACKLLAEHFCNFDIKNDAGQTALDVADSETEEFVAELKKTQAHMKKNRDENTINELNSRPQIKRRSSVTRMSLDQKHNMVLKSVEQERTNMEELRKVVEEKDDEKKGEPESMDDDTSSGVENDEEEEEESGDEEESEEESSESDTEKQNEKNNKISQETKSQADQRTGLPKQARVEIIESDRTQTKEDAELEIRLASRDTTPNDSDVTTTFEKTDPKFSHSLEKIDDSNKENRKNNEILLEKKDDLSEKETSKEKNDINQQGRERLAVSKTHHEGENDVFKETALAPPKTPTTPTDPDPSLWRAGLRKTGSSSAVPSDSHKPEDKLARSASSSWVHGDKSTEESIRTKRIQSASAAESTEATRNKRQMEAERHSVPIVTTVTTTIATIGSTATTTIPTAGVRRSYEPPKRDEEKEVERKAKAKRARETRRSTQGVTKEDIERAEESLKLANRGVEVASDKSKSKEREADWGDDKSDKENKPEQYSLSSSRNKRNAYSSSDIDKKDDDSGTRASLRRSRDLGLNNDATRYLRNSLTSSSHPTSSINSLEQSRSDSALASTANTSTSQSSSLTTSSAPYKSYMSSRVPYTSSYLSSRKEDDASAATTTTSSVTTRTTSSLSERKKGDTKDEKEDPSQKSSAIKSRRKRENRRPTGKINLEDIQGISLDETDSKQEKEEKKEDDSLKGSRYGSSRYSDPVGSTAYTTASSTGRDRPQSYSGTAYSRSYTSASIDSEKGGIDYKKLYEKEKLENEKLKKDMEKLKQEVSDLNYDLEKAKSKHESRTSDSREKRALERKISEYEEELKAMKNLEADNVRLKEENGALIRVISKLSK